MPEKKKLKLNVHRSSYIFIFLLLFVLFCVHSARCSGVFWKKKKKFFYKETANGGLVDLCIAGVCVLLFYFHSFSNLCILNVFIKLCVYTVHRRHVSNESGIVLNMYHVFQHVLSSFLNAYTQYTHTHTDSTKIRKPTNLYTVNGGLCTYM